MDPRELLVESATAASQTVGTESFMKLTGHAMNLTGEGICRHLSADDHPGLFVPVDVAREGKDRLGSVLALHDRAIIAWTVGVLRMKHFEQVIPYRAITTLEVTLRAGGPASKPREVLVIHAEDARWQLAFANVFDGGQSVVPYLRGTIDGSIRPVFGSGDKTSGSEPAR